MTQDEQRGPRSALREAAARIQPALRWFVVAVALSTLFACVEVFSAPGPDLRLFEVGVYLVQLLVPANVLGLAVVASALAFARTTHRALRLGALLLPLGALPYLASVSAALGGGVGVQAADQGALVRRLSLLVLAGGTLFVWAWLMVDRWNGRARRALWWGAGALAGVAFVWVDARYLRTYAFLAPLALSGTLLVWATLAWRLVPPGRAANRALTLLGVALGALYVAGLALPLSAAAGRRQVFRVDSAALHLDRLRYEPYEAQGVVQLGIEGFQPAQCAPSTVRLSPASARPHGVPRARNVILISVDALRADAVQWEHAGRPLMPALRRFRDGSVRAVNATTTYPATIFALGGAVTGLAPSQLLFAPTPAPSLLLAAQEAQDETHVLLPSSRWFRQPAIEELILQGTPARYHGDAGPLTDDAVEVLDAARREDHSLFLWAHYFEPHSPYRDHAESDLGSRERDRYREELVHLDRHLARLFEALSRGAWFDDSLVIFFADHGEALGERRYVGHHVFLNAWTMDVPFYYRAPGVAARERRDQVSITDVAPTVLDVLGRGPVEGAVGRSLFAPPDPGRAVVAEAFPVRGDELFRVANERITGVTQLQERMRLVRTQRGNYEPRVALVRGDLRLIVRRHTGATELYARHVDPDEARDLSDERPVVLASMLRELGRWHQRRSLALYCAALAAERR